MSEYPGTDVRLQLGKALVKNRILTCVKTYCQSTLRRPILEPEALHETFSALAIAATVSTSTLLFRLALVHTAFPLPLAFLRCLGFVPIRLRFVPCASLIRLRVMLLRASIPTTMLWGR